MTTVYVTKYALTSGIYKCDAVVNGGVAVVKLKGCLPQYFHVTEWSMSFNDALERAEEMRISKLHSLEKQAKKISSMQFKVVEKE